MRIGRALSAILAPSFSWCMRCGTAWKFVEPQTVEYHPVTRELPGYDPVTYFQKDHFALCQECWDEVDEDERVLIHMAAIREWWSEWDEQEVAEIIAAVRRESREPV